MKSNGRTRRLLVVGFGGLLLLLAFTGLNALSVLKRIQRENERIRQDYLHRNGILEQLRSDIYVSGTYARDLLLDPDPLLADLHKKEFESTRVRIAFAVADYDRILRTEEREPFQRFVRELTSYFDSLRPALQWNAEQRRALGYSFVRNSLLPRRTVIVQLADQISRVNQNQLDAGNRQVNNLFASFRRQLIVLFVLTLACGVVLAGVSITRLLRWERLSALRLIEAEQARSSQRELSARLLAVQESERKALSRELHDEVGQALSGLLLGIGNVAATVAPETAAETRSRLNDLRRLAERIVAIVRDMSLLLRPSMLDDLGLVPALQWQARETSRTKNISVEVHADSISDELPEEHKTCIYRIAQEALHNVARHANATNVRIHLKEGQSHTLELRIEDDGRGFVPEHERGVGLLGMEERVTHLGGTFRLDSKPGEGTRIYVELPFSPANVRQPV
jgi:signal transduction histidine kinase